MLLSSFGLTTFHKVKVTAKRSSYVGPEAVLVYALVHNAQQMQTAAD